MKIGMTYDLRQDYLDMGYSELETAEFDSIETVEAIEMALQSLGHAAIRIGNGIRLTERLVQGERWDLVFNIAEGLHGIGREAQIPAILDLYNIPYTFSDPMVMAVTLHKGMTKHIIRDQGIATANFIVADSDQDVWNVPFPPPFFVKPVAQGTGMGITVRSVVKSSPELFRVCRDLVQEFRQPVLIEEFLTGREFTVGIVGTGNKARAMGTMEILILEDGGDVVYSFENKEGWKSKVNYLPLSPAEDPLIGEVEELALTAWKVLGCRDGGRIDIRCDRSGRPNFIEVNPLAGLRPEYSDLPILCKFFGTSHVQLVQMILESALDRVALLETA